MVDSVNYLSKLDFAKESVVHPLFLVLLIDKHLEYASQYNVRYCQ